jgi:hypothetical protein
MSQHLPGYETGRSIRPREIMLTREAMIQVPIVVDGANSTDGGNTGFPYELRAGWPMAQVAATGLWTPCKRTTTTGAGGTGAAITVVDASAFLAGDAIDVGADTNQTIVSVDYATNTITLGASITWAADEAVVARDGSQTCRGFLLDFVRLRNEDNTAAADKSAGLLIQGAVKTEMLLGDMAAIRSDAQAKLAGIRFSDDHGQ